MPAYETKIAPGISIITLAPQSEYLPVAREMLSLFDRLLDKAKTDQSLPATELTQIEEWNSLAHSVFDAYASGERKTLRGVFGMAYHGLDRLMPESAEKKETLDRFLTATVNTYGFN